jgi:hypothetical protein
VFGAKFSASAIAPAAIPRRPPAQTAEHAEAVKFEKLGDDAGLRSAVLSTRLADDEGGGLFGFRFELPAAGSG